MMFQGETIAKQTMKIEVIDPQGTVTVLGRVYYHSNPILNFVVGNYERWRLERNIRRHNRRMELLTNAR
jgi:hypothetical protein